MLMFFGSRLFKYFKWGCLNGPTPDVACLGVSLVYRMSIAVALLHFLMFFICLCRTHCSAVINDGGWPLKFILVSGLFVAGLFIRNDFKVYGIIATAFSILFLMAQLIILIGMAYKWNNMWVELADKSEGCRNKLWIWLLVSFTIIFFLGGIGVLTYCYILYKDTQSRAVISINLVMLVVQFVLTLALPKVEGVVRSVFPCSFLFLISTFLTWSSLLSNPKIMRIPGLADTLVQIIVGFVIFLVTLIYLSVSTTSESSDKNKNAVETITEKVEEKVEESEKEEIKTAEPEEGKDPPELTLASALFHVIMLAASIYMAMVLTNWGNPVIKGTVSSVKLVNSTFCFWARIAAEWSANLLYVWTLIAPNVCKNRSFS